MADSRNLKDLKSTWGDSCQSMWAELLALAVTESHIVANYASMAPDRLLTDQFYVPELRRRLRDLKRDTFLERVVSYRHSVITSRIVILSAAFEQFLLNFVDDFIRRRPKYWDDSDGKRTKSGNKLYGEFSKQRGLVGKIEAFSAQANAGIKEIAVNLDYLHDVYVLRNVLAHRAGRIDKSSADSLKKINVPADQHIVISSDQLIELADHVLAVAAALDKKLVPRATSPTTT